MDLIGSEYRRGVGIILLNSVNEVFIAHRCKKRNMELEAARAPISEEDFKYIQGNENLTKLEIPHMPSLKDYLWQMPQGGIDEGESYEETARRELLEETGISSVSILKVSTCNYFYTIPFSFSQNVWEGKYKGQCQRWVLMRFLGKDAEVNLTSHDSQEFDAWRWIPPFLLEYIIAPFKREMYKKLLRDFNLKDL